MKQYLLISLICLVYTQDIRFIDEIFDEVNVTENVCTPSFSLDNSIALKLMGYCYF